jgi:hypothetical protein
MEQYKKLLPVRVPDEISRPLGHGVAQYDDLDFGMLVEMRWKHQTKQAASGIRMKKTRLGGSDDTTLHGQIIRQFHEALKEAQDERAAGSGLERDARWRGEAPAAGNAANAAAAAAKVSKQVSPNLPFLSLILYATGSILINNNLSIALAGCDTTKKILHEGQSTKVDRIN